MPISKLVKDLQEEVEASKEKEEAGVLQSQEEADASEKEDEESDVSGEEDDENDNNDNVSSF